jgi:hypothetical protein
MKVRELENKQDRKSSTIFRPDDIKHHKED